MSKPAPIVAAWLALVQRLEADADLLALLEGEIAATSGLHPTSLRRLVKLWLGGLSSVALERLATRACAGRPVGTVAIVAPGNLCVATWQAMVEALICGNRVLVRPGRGDPQAAGNLRRVLAQVNVELAERVEVLPFDRDDEAGWQQIWARAQALMVYGGDPAIRAVVSAAQSAGFDGPIRRHGHGVSMGFLPAHIAVDDGRLQELAPSLAHDVLLADGRGCLSLRTLLVEGDLDKTRWRRIAELLTEAFDATARMLPAGEIAMSLLAARRMKTEEAEFLAAGIGHAGWVRQDSAGQWALVASPQASMAARLTLSDLGPGARCLMLLPMSDRRQLPQLLSEVRPWLSALARPETAGLDAIATVAGFDRMCDFGQLQAPAADQPTDGVPAGTGLLVS